MKRRIDNQWLGLVLGLIGPLIGFWIYSLIKFPRYSFQWFIDFFIDAPIYQSSLATLALLFNLAIFLLFIWVKYNRAARGVLIATFVYVPIVIYLRFA